MKQYLYILIGLVLAFFIGKYSSPAKTQIKEVEKIVYKEKEIKEKDQNVTESEKETRLPDGTIIKEKVKTKETETRSRTEKEASKEKEFSKQIESRPNWMLIGSYEPDIKNFQEVYYSIGIQRRLLSEIYLGASVSSKRTVGLVLSLGF